MPASLPSPHYEQQPALGPRSPAGEINPVNVLTSGREQQLRLMLCVPRRLDHLALSSLLRRTRGVALIAATTDLTDAMKTCRSTPLDAAILDVSFPGDSAFKAATTVLGDRLLTSVGFLDDSFALWRAKAALSIPGACYFTRAADISLVCQRLKNPQMIKVECSEMPEVQVDESFCQDRSELEHLDVYGLLRLSPKEQIVMEWIVRGYPVREIAGIMNLSVSTIDNHKARLMKKLRLNKTSQLIRLGIQAGIVDMKRRAVAPTDSPTKPEGPASEQSC